MRRRVEINSRLSLPLVRGRSSFIGRPPGGSRIASVGIGVEGGFSHPVEIRREYLINVAYGRKPIERNHNKNFHDLSCVVTLAPWKDDAPNVARNMFS